MPADVEMGPRLAVPVAENDQRLAGQSPEEEIARLGNPLGSADAVPFLVADPIDFFGKDRRRHILLGRHREGSLLKTLHRALKGRHRYFLALSTAWAASHPEAPVTPPPG